MKRKGYDYVAPVAPPDLEAAPLLEFSSGYVQRSIAEFPKQGARPPWRAYQNYIQDMLAIRYGKLEDGEVHFGEAGDAMTGRDNAPAKAAE